MALDAAHAVRRTALKPWAARITDPEERAALGRALAPMLTPEVTLRLPPELRFDHPNGDIDAWIDAADGLAEIQTVTRRDTGALAGLLLLFPDGADLMIGYFLGPMHWGAGLASDMLAGLVESLDQGPPRRLFAGTDADNLASQRVLEKAGFTRLRDETPGETPDRAMFQRTCGR